MQTEWILILDYGGQYTQLIARRVREANVFCRIEPPGFARDGLLEDPALKGVVLSGGPSSVFAQNAPSLPDWFERYDGPVLGICYGMQLLARAEGGEVAGGGEMEFGPAELRFEKDAPLFQGLDSGGQVWMSHGDRVTELPAGYERVGSTADLATAAIANVPARRYGVQFHPEVMHTTGGTRMLGNFLREVCGCAGTWTPDRYAESKLEAIRRATADGGEVLCGVSGGVDSTVTARLLQTAVGDRLRAVFVDNGLLRKGEREWVMETFQRGMGIDLHCIDGAALFLERLAGVADPEEKRRIIGHTFVQLFEEHANDWPEVRYLAQGTLYPDVIESTSTGGPSAKIKTHHNVGGLPETLALSLVEPLRDLFKDEVRALGRELGVPDELLMRHPFPGPGLAVRVLGPVDERSLNLLRECDDRYLKELHASGWYDKTWQAFAVLLPVQSVGVQGDRRSYERALALRAVSSVDGMTADWSRLPHDLLARISTRVMNEVSGVNRIVYDISSKPPATIEWE